ncbi:hypothetical protein RRG08_034209 [Elysia crispata]|uniref:Uncharacterized protein n=1 Tax=Elysia crispata TaxID=231223 RepID=A0AAE1A1U4_9GAST|nr:hypothetical protein RRG08_034209 [Elysia crispata]
MPGVTARCFSGGDAVCPRPGPGFAPVVSSLTPVQPGHKAPGATSTEGDYELLTVLVKSAIRFVATEKSWNIRIIYHGNRTPSRSNLISDGAEIKSPQTRHRQNMTGDTSKLSTGSSRVLNRRSDDPSGWVAKRHSKWRPSMKDRSVKMICVTHLVVRMLSGSIV